MMKIRFFTTLSLLAVLLAACAPSTAPPEAEATQPVLTESTTEPSVVPTQEVVATVSTPLAVATSRGPELHATDPSTVSLASGQIQLVEFFRFT